VIAIAAIVVVLCGGFAAAWFSGALDNVFNRNQPSGQVSQLDDGEDKKDIFDDEGGNGDNGDNGDNGGGGGDIGGDDGSTSRRAVDSVFAELFSDLGITTHISNDPSPKGAVEETTVNLANMLLGSVRNLSWSETNIGGNAFGIETNLQLNLSDEYISEIMSAVSEYASEEDSQKLQDVVRLVGASALNITFEGSGDIEGSNWRPVLTLDADWRIKAKQFLAIKSYFDLDEMLLSAPDLFDKLLYWASTLTPIPLDGLEDFGSQLEQIGDLGNYIDMLTPYIDEMLIAGIKELDGITEGRETISISGNSLTLDTINIKLTEESVTRVAIAALTVLKNNPAAQNDMIMAYNDSLANILMSPPIDSQTMTVLLERALSELEGALEYADTEEVLQFLLYMNNGVLSGFTMSSPDGYSQFGFITAPNSGYSFWFNDFSYVSYQEVEDLNSLSYEYPGIGDRYEVYGALNSDARGLSGDLRLSIHDAYNEEDFDAKLMSFSDLNMKALFGIPMLTGRFSVSMSDIYEAFDGKESSNIRTVWEMAYALKDFEETPFVKDIDFDLILEGTGSDYSISFIATDLMRDSDVSLSFKFYSMIKTLSPPTGDRFDIENASSMELMQLSSNVMTNAFAKIDELTDMGYDLAWLKEDIMALIRSGEFPGGDVFGGGDIGDYGNIGDDGDDGDNGDGGDIDSDFDIESITGAGVTDPTILAALADFAREIGLSRPDYITDAAGLLSPSEREELQKRAAEIAEKYLCEVYIITVNDMHKFDFGYDNSDDEDAIIFSRTIYDGFRLGAESDRNCLMLCLSLEGRDYCLAPYGFAEIAFTSTGIDEMLNNYMLPQLASGGFYEAFSAFLDKSEEFLELALEGAPYGGY